MEFIDEFSQFFRESLIIFQNGNQLSNSGDKWSKENINM